MYWKNRDAFPQMTTEESDPPGQKEGPAHADFCH